MRNNKNERSAFHFLFVRGYECVARLVLWLPNCRPLNWIKACFFRVQGAKIGRRVTFYHHVWIMPGKNLVVGDDVDFSVGVMVDTGGGVEIGARTLIGYRSVIMSTNHGIPAGRGRIFDAPNVPEPVRIGEDVWIGAHCMILPGVTIGEGAVVGAGSVVTKPVEPFAIVAGVPARLIRKRE